MLDCPCNRDLLYADCYPCHASDHEYLPPDVFNLDYASVVFAGFTSISAVWYVVWGRKNFVGPVMHVKGADGQIQTLDATPINSDTGSNEKSDL